MATPGDAAATGGELEPVASNVPAVEQRCATSGEQDEATDFVLDGLVVCGADPGVDTPGGGRKRARFEAADDLSLVRAVRKYEPYAAEHGSKIRVWEQIANETQLHSESVKDVHVSSRAVADRFRLLLKLHRNGTLAAKLGKAASEELCNSVEEALRDIADRIETCRLGASRRKRRRGLGTQPILDGLAMPESVVVDFSAEVPDADRGVETFQLRSEDDANSSPLNVITTADEMTMELPTPEKTVEAPDQQALASQALEIKRATLELKKRKLELLAQHHADRMALLERRMDLEAQRFRDESVARRNEWAALLAVLRTAQPVDSPRAAKRAVAPCSQPPPAF